MNTSVIAGKTHSEILTMELKPRFLWYKTISPKEKEEAMEIVETVRRVKLRVVNTGENNPFFGKTQSKEARAKMSVAWTRENNPRFGKALTEEHKTKLSVKATGRVHTKETRVKMCVTKARENNPNWQGGTSFEPYCPSFNYDKKELVRNRDNRRCQLCGKPEILEGRRLSVHHINSDKMQGCQGKKWGLVTLCGPCNSGADTLEKEFLIVSNLNLRRNE